MNFRVLFSSVCLALPLSAVAAGKPPPPPKQGWSGSGEAGLAASSGNTKAQNLNAKLDIKFNSDRWKDEFYLIALRNKNDVTLRTVDNSTDPPTTVTTRQSKLTANRYEAGASAGYKVDDHSYVVGALRYEHDQFSPYRHQSIATIGYGYQVLKNARDELAFEVGGGYKSAQPTSYESANPTPPPDLIEIAPDAENSAVARGKFEYKHSFNDVTSFTNAYLVESSSDNTFMQNDAGLQVKMNSNLALKVGYQVRHNSDVRDGFKKTDQLLTTNLVYGF
jgi:putative salt-induced outer membrane protein